jgi:hypothetical protein
MLDLCFSIGVFGFAVLVHLLVHRILEKNKIHTFFTVTVFFIIGIILSWSLVSKSVAQTSLPYTSILLYWLLSILTSLLFTAPYAREKSPTMLALLLLNKFGRMQKRKLYTYLLKEDMIQKRIDVLLKQKIIIRKKNTFYVLPRGNRVLVPIETYRHILRWHKGG